MEEVFLSEATLITDTGTSEADSDMLDTGSDFIDLETELVDMALMGCVNFSACFFTHDYDGSTLNYIKIYCLYQPANHGFNNLKKVNNKTMTNRMSNQSM